MAKFISIDPSLTNTAIVFGQIEDDKLIPENHVLLQTQPTKNKQVRASSDLVNRSRFLLNGLIGNIKEFQPDIIFAETPSGSQSFRGGLSYAISCALIASCDPAAIEVTPMEVKKVLGKGKISKKQIINYVAEKYPNFHLPIKRGGAILEGEAEHIADAIVAAEAGIKTTQYLQIKNLLK